VFRDEWERFALQQEDHPERLALLRHCLADARMGRGFTDLFDALKTATLTDKQARDHLHE